MVGIGGKFIILEPVCLRNKIGVRYQLLLLLLLCVPSILILFAPSKSIRSFVHSFVCSIVRSLFCDNKCFLYLLLFDIQLYNSLPHLINCNKGNIEIHSRVICTPNYDDVLKTCVTRQDRKLSVPFQSALARVRQQLVCVLCVLRKQFSVFFV